jgi:protein phosphatase
MAAAWSADTPTTEARGHQSASSGEETAWAVIADGLGGPPAGDVASQLAVEEVSAYLRRWEGPPEGTGSQRALLREAVVQAHHRLLSHQQAHPQTEGMSTTLVAVLVSGGQFALAWVGDSRLYHLDREGRLSRISRDHTLVEEMIQGGRLTEEEALGHPLGHVLNQALGGQPEAEMPQIDTEAGHWRPGEGLLLSTDGLHDSVSDRHLARHGHEGWSPAELGAHYLDDALAAGGKDNISLVLLKRTDDAS